MARRTAARTDDALVHALIGEYRALDEMYAPFVGSTPWAALADRLLDGDPVCVWAWELEGCPFDLRARVTVQLGRPVVPG
ncbi:hypothetical protein ACLQ3K_16100 [Tsukamurella sp. DT100]|uniref:hypothetical protein n=1 Tax=Tsukamurella sp. DT100 TaxID=3393415 RepID=UPI003CE775AF